MSGHVDEFIIAALLQLSLQASRCMGNEGTPHVENLYMSVINALTSVRILCLPLPSFLPSTLSCVLSVPKPSTVMNSNSLLDLTLGLCVAGFSRQTGSRSLPRCAEKSVSLPALVHAGPLASAELQRISRAHPLRSNTAQHFIHDC